MVDEIQVVAFADDLIFLGHTQEDLVRMLEKRRTAVGYIRVTTEEHRFEPESVFGYLGI